MPDTASADALQTEDITYYEGEGGPLFARLYRPAGTGSFPAIVSVHGGAWTFGDRLMNESLDRALAEAGILVMAIDFRMPPIATYPGSIQDVNLATRWLKLHAARYGADIARIGGMGTSSGGHQIMLSALRPDFPAYAAHPLPGGEALDASLAYVVIGWGVLDPLARYRMAQERGMEAALKAHHAWWPDEAAMEDGNPQMILDRAEPTPLPPVLLLQGTADTNLTEDMARRFAATYRARGGKARLEEFPGEGHLFATQNPESDAARRAMALAIGFIREHGQG